MLITLTNKIESRQIPKAIEICSNKKYHDILYSYLQDISEWDGVAGHARYVPKKVINYSRLGETLGLTRQTVSTKFKNLLGLGLIREKDNDTYELDILSKDIAFLLPYKTLKLLVDALSENSISTYIYLLRKYLANDQKECQFSLTEIKKYIGVCATTRSNDEIITNILTVLKRIGLIDYHLTTKADEKSGDVKTIYQLDFVTNYIEC